ncbi:MAG: PaaX family transcriptional regulator C-terminal domain-containing protein [Nocardioidaceae bacterium]
MPDACGRLLDVNARSALFDVYGDHLRPRGGAAPVAALVRILAPLDIAAPAVRTAISRMVRQQWLAAIKLDQGAGYRLTPRAERRLTDAAHRIYRSGIAPWDRRWHLLVVDHVANRGSRDRVRTALGYLGYAVLRDDTWISPRASSEVDSLFQHEGVRAQRFWSEHDGNDAALAAQAWDLEGLGRAYCRWLDEARGLVSGVAGDGGHAGHDGVSAPDELTDQDAFVVRSRLVHEWRKFLFRDPGLPRELLPKRWPGDDAAAFFDSESARLMPAAGRYVDACLQPNATSMNGRS